MCRAYGYVKIDFCLATVDGSLYEVRDELVSLFVLAKYRETDSTVFQGLSESD